jgi:hypothetical protein
LMWFIPLRYVYKSTHTYLTVRHLFITNLIAATCFGSYYAILRLYKIL